MTHRHHFAGFESSIQPELLSLRAKLVDEVERDEKQIGLLSNRAEKNKALLHAVNGSLGAIIAEATGYGAVADTIRSTIKSLPMSRFTPVDVERAIRMQHPTAPFTKESIRTTLWNLVKRGEITTVRKGNNREPAMYEQIVRIKRTTEEARAQTLGAIATLPVNSNGQKAGEGARA